MAESSTESISCSLGASAAAHQLREWQSLTDEALGVGPLPDGARIRLPAHMAEVAGDLASREASCCSFLEIAVTVEQGEDGPEVVVDIRSVNPEGLLVVSALTGVTLP